jgi:hypothetical protein
MNSSCDHGAVQDTMTTIGKHLDIPYAKAMDDTPKNTRDYQPIVDNDTNKYLQRFYEPHDERLEAISSQLENNSETWSMTWNDNN